MTYDLRSESWIPFRRLSGRIDWGPPDLIADQIAIDPVVEFASPRPDFDGALAEFLIGLLTAAMMPRDTDQWIDRWEHTPTREELNAALASLPDAFDLDGDGPRFMQDFSPGDLAEYEVAPIQELLVEGKNDPLFIKPGSLNRLGRPAAAMALIAIQSYSPAGGRGYRTSLRGGGPLTTLVDARTQESPLSASLWRYLWANVLTRDELPGGSSSERTKANAADIYPWLAPTRTSENDRATTLSDVHPLQVFFGMPRRLRLEFADEAAACELTGRPDARPVVGFRVRGYGVQYKAWVHPLTPYYTGKTENDLLPRHGQAGGIGWRDWLSLTHGVSAVKTAKRPAVVVSVFNERRVEPTERTEYRLRIYGFDVNNAKALAWTDAKLPVFTAPEANVREAIKRLAESLAEATAFVASALQRAITDALYGKGSKPPGDLDFFAAGIWDATEDAFYQALRRGMAGGGDVPEAARQFYAALRDAVDALFGVHVDTDATHPLLMRRAIVARYELTMTMNGQGKSGAKLFGLLGLETPSAAREGKAAKRKRTEAQT